MAAIYYKPLVSGNTIFASGFAANNSIYVPFLSNLIGSNDALIITEVSVQHRDNIQYFVTFDDFIRYYYFGKALGHIAINGMIFSDCSGRFGSLNTLMNRLSSVRGSSQNVSVGNVTFVGVMSNFTLRANSDPAMLHALDFMVQLDVIDNSMPPANFYSSC